MPNPDLIGSAESADIIGIDRSTLNKWVAQGHLTPAVTLPGKTGAQLFDRADVTALRDRYQPKPRLVPVEADSA